METAATEGALKLFGYGASGVFNVVLIAFVWWIIKMWRHELKETRLDMLKVLKEANERDREANKNEADQSHLMRQIIENQQRCFDHCSRRNS